MNQKEHSSEKKSEDDTSITIDLRSKRDMNDLMGKIDVILLIVLIAVIIWAKLTGKFDTTVIYTVCENAILNTTGAINVS